MIVLLAQRGRKLQGESKLEEKEVSEFEFKIYNLSICMVYKNAGNLIYF